MHIITNYFMHMGRSGNLTSEQSFLNLHVLECQFQEILLQPSHSQFPGLQMWKFCKNPTKPPFLPFEFTFFIPDNSQLPVFPKHRALDKLQIEKIEMPSAKIRAGENLSILDHYFGNTLLITYLREP